MYFGRRAANGQVVLAQQYMNAFCYNHMDLTECMPAPFIGYPAVTDLCNDMTSKYPDSGIGSRLPGQQLPGANTRNFRT